MYPIVLIGVPANDFTVDVYGAGYRRSRLRAVDGLEHRYAWGR
jgi:hypothetical protein